MYKWFLITAIFCLSAIEVMGQDRVPFSAGSFEVCFTGSLGSMSYSNEYTTYYGSGKNKDSKVYLLLAASPAIYLTDGLSIEPEINLLLYKGSEPAISLLANLSYTFVIEDQNIAPFVRLGYGISNSMHVPSLSGTISRVSNEMDVPIFNAGAGFKILLTKNVAFRTEINFRSMSYTEENSYSGRSSKYERTYSFISGIFGFSILL